MILESWGIELVPKVAKWVLSFENSITQSSVSFQRSLVSCLNDARDQMECATGIIGMTTQVLSQESQQDFITYLEK